MPIDHRLYWSTRHVTQKLIERKLAEQATFACFLAIMAFDWLQFSIIAVTPDPIWCSGGHLHTIEHASGS